MERSTGGIGPAVVGRGTTACQERPDAPTRDASWSSRRRGIPRVDRPLAKGGVTFPSCSACRFAITQVFLAFRRPVAYGDIGGTEGGSDVAEKSALTVAQKAWEFWVAADLDGFLSLWHEEGVWTNAGHSQISGARQGHQAIGDVARTVFELSGGTFKAHPVELVASGDDTVLGRFHMVAERDNVTLEQDGLQRMVVHDGQVVTLDNLFS